MVLHPFKKNTAVYTVSGYNMVFSHYTLHIMHTTPHTQGGGRRRSPPPPHLDSGSGGGGQPRGVFCLLRMSFASLVTTKQPLGRAGSSGVSQYRVVSAQDRGSGPAASFTGISDLPHSVHCVPNTWLDQLAKKPLPRGVFRWKPCYFRLYAVWLVWRIPTALDYVGSVTTFL